jgi:hypothetical protein
MNANCIRFRYNTYYPNRAAVLKPVTYLAETYLGRFDSRGYANSVLVGPQPGWESGLEEMSACLATLWPRLEFSLECSTEPFHNRRRAFQADNPKCPCPAMSATSRVSLAPTEPDVTSRVAHDTFESSATSSVITASSASDVTSSDLAAANVSSVTSRVLTVRTESSVTGSVTITTLQGFVYPPSVPPGTIVFRYRTVGRGKRTQIRSQAE